MCCSYGSVSGRSAGPERGFPPATLGADLQHPGDEGDAAGEPAATGGPGWPSPGPGAHHEQVPSTRPTPDMELAHRL